MKKIIVTACIVLLITLLNAQNQEVIQVSKIIGTNKIEINAGKKSGINAGDMFQVFSSGQVKLQDDEKFIEINNIYLGIIRVIKVKDEVSIAEIIEKKQKIKRIEKYEENVANEYIQSRYINKMNA